MGIPTLAEIVDGQNKLRQNEMKQINNCTKDAFVSESNQEVPKFGMDDDDGENQENIDDSVNFYDNDSKKIDDLEKGENVNCENRDSKEAIKSKHLNEKINDEELVVTTDELIGMPSMAG